MAEAASVRDLSLKDLVHPDPERTRTILSAIINLAKFSDEQEDRLKALRDQSTNMIEERIQVTREIEDLRRQVAEIKFVQTPLHPALYLINL